MIKVIKRKYARVHCHKCESLLQYEESDKRMAEVPVHGKLKCITCPDCGATIPVAQEAIDTNPLLKNT